MRWSPRLDRMVLAEIVGPFVGSAALFTGLFFAGGELVRFAEYLQGGEGWALVGRLILLSLPGILSLTFPMAMLLATLLGMGRLSGDGELVAVVATGTRFERVMLPVAAFGLFVSLIGMVFNQNIVPNANRARQAIIDGVKNKSGVAPSSANAFTLPLRDDKNNLTLIHADGGVDMATDTLLGVSVQVWKNGEMVSVIAAPSAKWKSGKNWTFTNYKMADFSNPDSPVLSRGDKGQTFDQTLGTPEALLAQSRPVNEVTSTGLRKRADLLRAGRDDIAANAAEVELANRVQLPLASLAFALIGAPLGVRPQRAGKGVGFGLSVLITFVYWMSMQVVSVLGRGGTLPPGLALAPSKYSLRGFGNLAYSAGFAVKCKENPT